MRPPLYRGAFKAFFLPFPVMSFRLRPTDSKSARASFCAFAWSDLASASAFALRSSSRFLRSVCEWLITSRSSLSFNASSESGFIIVLPLDLLQYFVKFRIALHTLDDGLVVGIGLPQQRDSRARKLAYAAQLAL